MFDREPVESFENGSDICIFWGTWCTILNTLKFLKEEIGESIQERVAVVQT